MLRRVLVAILVLTPAIARGDGSAQRFVSIGGSSAYTFHSDGDDGDSLGIEVSAGKLRVPEDHDLFHFDPWWAGGYVDLVKDHSVDALRLSIGPEFGHHYLGLDAGLMVQLGDDRRVGVSIRPAVTLGAATITFRYGRYFDDEPGPQLLELGLLVKWPIRF